MNLRGDIRARAVGNFGPRPCPIVHRSVKLAQQTNNKQTTSKAAALVRINVSC
jgi:hypothetical protein